MTPGVIEVLQKPAGQAREPSFNLSPLPQGTTSNGNPPEVLTGLAQPQGRLNTCTPRQHQTRDDRSPAASLHAYNGPSGALLLWKLAPMLKEVKLPVRVPRCSVVIFIPHTPSSKQLCKSVPQQKCRDWSGKCTILAARLSGLHLRLVPLCTSSEAKSVFPCSDAQLHSMQWWGQKQTGHLRPAVSSPNHPPGLARTQPTWPRRPGLSGTLHCGVGALGAGGQGQRVTRTRPAQGQHLARQRDTTEENATHSNDVTRRWPIDGRLVLPGSRPAEGRVQSGA